MKTRTLGTRAMMAAAMSTILLAGCSSAPPQTDKGVGSVDPLTPAAAQTTVQHAVNFDRTLDDYVPQKDHYNFYFTYKTVHAWWDAVLLGMEDAQQQLLDRGVVVTYKYVAPDMASAEDQAGRLRAATRGRFDVIGVDVADEQAITPIIDQLVDEGAKVMTFSSSDAAPGCRRFAYVGNTHNYQDGADLTEALCAKLDHKGKVAILVGNIYQDDAAMMLELLYGVVS